MPTLSRIRAEVRPDQCQDAKLRPGSLFLDGGACHQQENSQRSAEPEAVAAASPAFAFAAAVSLHVRKSPKSRLSRLVRCAGRFDFVEPSFQCSQSTMPSRPRKLLVYLDQNFISEMAKQGHGGVRPDFRELYSVLQKGFWNEQLVVLRSRFHDVETSLAGALKDAIRARRSTLGHVDLASQWDIRESQIVASLHKFLDRHDDKPVICYEDAFEDEPDTRVGHLDINVNMDWMHAEAKEQRQRLAAELDTVRRRILENSTSYDEQFRIEMDASRHEALRPYYLRHHTAAAGVTDEEYRQFVASSAFANVPIVWLDVALLTRLMTAHSTRTIKQGDVTDIDAMATYLPYCDVYGADRFMAEVARSLQVPERYNCHLFDSRKDGVTKLIDHLRNVLVGIAPVNMPELSIFVAAADGIKENSFSFFRKIGNQAKMSENRCGEWIELFAFDDGRMPRYEMRQAPGMAAPFYGLQDVLVIKCGASDGTDALVKAARKECRSTHFVLVDAYQDLPDDFIMQALATPRDGKSSVLGYRVYSRDR